MNGSTKYSRLAGLSLLGSLGFLTAGLSTFPSFDARSEYFARYLPSLMEQRGELALALALFALTGVLIILTGIFLILAFSRSGVPNPIPGIILLLSGAGFLLSAALGQPALRIFDSAAELPGNERLARAAEAYPWASGSQSILLIFGLGLLALGLFVVIATMLRTGAFTRRMIVLAVATPALVWIGIALTIEAPLVWLVPALPIVMWSVGLGIFLTITGRVTVPVSIPTA